MTAVRHLTETIDGHRVFYREAGPRDAPVLVLLHGFPTSSHMFRRLIPALAEDYRVIAPDYLGFGVSDMPAASEFDYTFDALADITAKLLDRLEVNQFAIYVQDYGAPVGWRLAVRAPERITAAITQNGNAYTDGFVEEFWKPVLAYGTAPGPDTEGPLRGALTLEAVKWQYLNGANDESLVSPDNWIHDLALLDRPGNDEIQLALFRDYMSNVERYPEFQQYFRDSQVPLLAVWGGNDEIFGPAGARAFVRDLPKAEVHLLDTGHFALETHLDTIAGYIRDFLGRHVS
jgi:pimeloyl-ACP methyl ester carboxylesterase